MYGSRIQLFCCARNIDPIIIATVIWSYRFMDFVWLRSWTFNLSYGQYIVAIITCKHIVSGCFCGDVDGDGDAGVVVLDVRICATDLSLSAIIYTAVRSSEVESHSRLMHLGTISKTCFDFTRLETKAAFQKHQPIIIRPITWPFAYVMHACS